MKQKSIDAINREMRKANADGPTEVDAFHTARLAPHETEQHKHAPRAHDPTEGVWCCTGFSGQIKERGISIVCAFSSI